MITLAIAAILVTVGIPAFTNLMIKNQLSGQIQNLYGRSTSRGVKRSSVVIMSPSVKVMINPLVVEIGAMAGLFLKIKIMIFQQSGTILVIQITRNHCCASFPALPEWLHLNTNTNFVNSVTYDRLGMANNRGTVVLQGQ